MRKYRQKEGGRSLEAHDTGIRPAIQEGRTADHGEHGDGRWNRAGHDHADGDAEKADKLYHALKSAATYHAMKDAEEWEDKDASGRSYRRGRDAMGRYTSMDMRGYSGHYMPYPPRYPQSYEYPEDWR